MPISSSVTESVSIVVSEAPPLEPSVATATRLTELVAVSCG